MNAKLFFTSRHKLFVPGIALLLLATADSFFTDFGIQQKHITEANPLMRVIYDWSILGFYTIKICLPLVLLIILTMIEPRRYFQILIVSSLLLYSFVFFKHILWISLVL
ncbi:MAG TPA: DUF5658 family protein [Sporosarcina psychrophila]|uniref:DUF5658 family protein n=1 Tax=Sporosarcina psychrophila TaxID=1476 RepID=A0A921FWY0_SPOPS|nr:DUF5658 family protein [Sporosarcina psychrophila]